MKIDFRIGGEIIPLYFGMVAFEEMQKLLGTGYVGSNKFAVDVVWSGYLNHCAVESNFPLFTHQMIYLKFEEFFFGDDEDDTNLNEVLSAFDQSKAGAKLFERVDKAVEIIEKVGEDLKKKMKKMPTKQSKK